MIKTIVIMFYTQDKFAICYLVDGDYSESNGKDAIDIVTGNTDDYGDDETIWSLTLDFEGFHAVDIPKLIKDEERHENEVKVITCFTE